MTNNENEEIRKKAVEFVKEKKKMIIERFASNIMFKPTSYPVSVFMAGSPGAGKTEVSKDFIAEFGEKDPFGIVRIDTDEIRNLMPGYTGGNSSLFQRPCSLAVEKILDHVLSKNKHFILDGTFGSYGVSYKNIKRSLDKNRFVVIIYVYQDPVIAWGFTQKREKLEGRNIPKESFVEQFFKARENVNKIKEEFKDKIYILLVEKNYINRNKKIKFNINNIDNHIINKYSKEQLNKLL